MPERKYFTRVFKLGDVYPKRQTLEILRQRIFQLGQTAQTVHAIPITQGFALANVIARKINSLGDVHQRLHFLDHVKVEMVEIDIPIEVNTYLTNADGDRLTDNEGNRLIAA